jgi:thiamine biosynthesis lipoprotein
MQVAQRHKALHACDAIFIAFFAISFVVGCFDSEDGNSNPIVSLAGQTMGTTYTVKLKSLPTGLTKTALQTEIDRRLEAVNNQMSTWRLESEISRFNQSESTEWFEVSPATVRVLREASRISELSDGAFDVTVSPLVSLWGFNRPNGEQGNVPTDEAIGAIKQQVGYELVTSREKKPALRKSHPQTTIDLSGIAKGYGVDVIADYLTETGMTAYMVEIGGEVRARGRKPDGSAWTIGIEKPTESGRALLQAVALIDRALATSGDYRNFFEQDGKRYSHTIDPRTGRPIEFRLASVSVVSESCMTADALATALMVLGPRDGYNLAEKHGWAVLMVVRTDDGFEQKSTPEFQRILKDKTETR